MQHTRQIVPTARVLAVAPFHRFLTDNEQLRAGQLQGALDALLWCPAGCATRSSTWR